jgi:hypothetical protein
VLGPAIYTMAPLLAAQPTMEALNENAVELTIIFIGAVLLLLQAAVDRPAAPTGHAVSPMATA